MHTLWLLANCGVSAFVVGSACKVGAPEVACTKPATDSKDCMHSQYHNTTAPPSRQCSMNMQVSFVLFVFRHEGGCCCDIS